jgi:hypothetical protein
VVVDLLVTVVDSVEVIEVGIGVVEIILVVERNVVEKNGKFVNAGDE